jgi:hypothetical protein
MMPLARVVLLEPGTLSCFCWGSIRPSCWGQTPRQKTDWAGETLQLLDVVKKEPSKGTEQPSQFRLCLPSL